MHPMLKPALRRAWRSRDTVQFGVARAHAVVVGPLDTATGSFLELLDGTRGLPLLRQEAQALGLPEERADELLDRLTAAGLLDDTRPGDPPAALVSGSAAALDRLRPDAAGLSVQHPEPGAAARLLAARRATRVQVRGAGRVGETVAAVLSSAGVGQIDVVDGGCVEPWDVAPGGLVARADRRAAGCGRASAGAPDRTGPAATPADRGAAARRGARAGPGGDRPARRSRGVRTGSGGGRAAARLRHTPSVRGRDRGHRGGGAPGPPGRHPLRGLRRGGPCRAGAGVAADAGPVAVRPPRCRARL
ncbi:UBA/THIF-type NAD/FAD binding fold protein [Streptomyces himastatinicus ATCC 53653]|uniref:UBA/THIF-type NAD/FAD binding fold protein n=1 Tax=Streptomyces himastatinicus ATCC 53653 TaxID=457427 RepID=D9WI05_9ACTN|nr:UBA/THIF-type NAD/FAD binding fold protein [Streptomyces himastatinicus ATCC 53653]